MVAYILEFSDVILPVNNVRHGSVNCSYVQGGPKTDTQIYFGDNFGNSAPILTILLLLQEEIHGA